MAQAIHQMSVSRKRGHLEGVNAFFAQLTAEARASGGTVRLVEWRSEEEAASLFLGKVRPDGAGTLAWDGGAAVPFCFEYDTGSETLDRLAAKLDRYAARQPVGGHRAVLIQLTRSGRETNLHRRLTGSVFPFAVATTVSAYGLLEANWRQVGAAARAGLAALAAGAVIS